MGKIICPMCDKKFKQKYFSEAHPEFCSIECINLYLLMMRELERLSNLTYSVIKENNKWRLVKNGR